MMLGMVGCEVLSAADNAIAVIPGMAAMDWKGGARLRRSSRQRGAVMHRKRSPDERRTISAKRPAGRAVGAAAM
jgi:hypothetical protein